MASPNSLPSTSNDAGPNLGQEQDLTSVNSTTDLRIVTSLMYHYFNENDTDDKDRSNAEVYHLIKQWKELNGRLSELHTRRLRKAAEAAGWEDVARILTPVSEHQNLNQNRTLSDHEQRPSPLDLHLPSLIDQEATRYAANAEIPRPSQGTMRSHKVRVLISRHGEIQVELAPQSASSEVTHGLLTIFANYTICPFTLDVEGQRMCLVTVDTESTVPGLITRHKTTCRDPYNTARARAVPGVAPTALPTEREVLLVNTQDEIMEASVSSVYFHRMGRWVTPSSECGGMQSVTKMYALEKGWCVEGVVGRDSVTNGEIVWLGNAVRGFFAGKILVSV